MRLVRLADHWVTIDEGEYGGDQTGPRCERRPEKEKPRIDTGEEGRYKVGPDVTHEVSLILLMPITSAMFILPVSAVLDTDDGGRWELGSGAYDRRDRVLAIPIAQTPQEQD